MIKLIICLSPKRFAPLSYEPQSLLIQPMITENCAILYQLQRNHTWIRKGYLHEVSRRCYADVSVQTNILIESSNEIPLTPEIAHELFAACKQQYRTPQLHVRACLSLNLSDYIAGDHVLITSGTSPHPAKLLEIIANEEPSDGLKYHQIGLIDKKLILSCSNTELKAILSDPKKANDTSKSLVITAEDYDSILEELFIILEPTSPPRYGYGRFLAKPNRLENATKPSSPSSDRTLSI